MITKHAATILLRQRFNLKGKKYRGAIPPDHGHVTSAGGLAEAGEGLYEFWKDAEGEPLILPVQAQCKPQMGLYATFFIEFI
jgi:hypothetical protein